MLFLRGRRSVIAHLCAIAAFGDAFAKGAFGAENHGFDGVAVFHDSAADGNGDGDAIAPPCDFAGVDHATEAFGSAFDFVAAALGEDGEELVALPATEIIGGANGVFERLADDAENYGDGARSVARQHFVEMIHLHAKDGERDVMLFEDADIFSDMRLSDAVIEDAAGFVDAAVGGEFGLAAIPLGESNAFFEAFGGADDDAFGIADGERPELHGNAVAGLVAHRDERLRRLAVAHGSGGGSKIATELVVFAIRLAEKIVGVEAADDVLAEIASDALGTVVPEEDFAFAIDDVDGNVKVVEDAAEEVDFRETRHSFGAPRGIGGASLIPSGWVQRVRESTNSLGFLAGVLYLAAQFVCVNAELGMMRFVSGFDSGSGVPAKQK